jgi:hypothetical protein
MLVFLIICNRHVSGPGYFHFVRENHTLGVYTLFLLIFRCRN